MNYLIFFGKNIKNCIYSFLITDPACQLINTQSNCYVMEPSCPSQEPNGVQHDTNSYVTVVSVFLGIFIVVIIATMIVLIIKRNMALNKGIYIYI